MAYKSPLEYQKEQQAKGAPAPSLRSQAQKGPTVKQQQYIADTGFQPKSLPTFRSEQSKRPKGVLDTIFDVLGRGESGGVNAAMSIADRAQGASKKFQKGDILGGVVDHLINSFGSAAVSAPSFIEGAFGNKQVTGQNYFDRAIDQPGLDKLPGANLLKSDVGRTVGGLATGVAFDPLTFIGIGDVAKVTGADKLIAKGGAKALENPTIRSIAAKYAGKGFAPEYKAAKEAFTIGTAQGDEAAVLVQKLLRNGLDKKEVVKASAYLPQIGKEALNEINTAIKAGEKINPEELYKIASGIEKATPGSTLEKAGNLLRNVIDPQSKKLMELGKITPEMLAKNPDYLHLSYNAAQGIGGDTLQQFSKGATKAGITEAEKGLLKVKKVEPLRVLESLDNNGHGLIDKTQLQELGAIKQEFTDQVTARLGGSTSKSDILRVQNEVANELAPRIKSITGEQNLREIALQEQKARGLISDATVLGPQTAQLQNRLIQNTEFLDKVTTLAKEFGNSADALKAGYKQIPSGEKWGPLAGKYVPDVIADDLQHVIDPSSSNFMKKAVGIWKQLKLFSPLNTATNTRNWVSNQVLNSMVEDGLPIYRQDIYAKAALELEKGGPIYERYIKAGGGVNTFAANELDRGIKGVGENLKLNKVKEVANRIMDGASLAPGVGFGRNAFGKTEEAGKLAQFMYQTVVKKKSDKAALEVVNKALFDYSKLPTGLQKLKDSAIPFLSFKYFAAELFLDTLVNRTGKIAALGKGQRALETLSGDNANEKDLPGYMKDNRSNYFRLPPFANDANGNSRYIDATYLLPFGDVAGGFDPQDIALGNPFLRQAVEQGTNRNIYMDKPLTESVLPQDQIKDRLQYAIEQLGPKTPLSPVSYEQNKIISAATGNKNRYGARETLPTVGADIFAGLKVRTVDPGKTRASNQSQLDKRLSDVKSDIKSVNKNKGLSGDQKKDQINKLKEYRKQLIEQYKN